jgi:transcriptional regulator with XRE-family HTH domain
VELLGAEIKKIRNQKNMTQTDLGKKVGVTKYQISRIEADTTHVNMQTIIKVLNALGKELSFNII